MTLVTREVQSYTPEQVRDVLLNAIAVVTELEVPAGLKAEAFRAAVQMFSAKRIEQTQLGAGIVPNGLGGR